MSRVGDKTPCVYCNGGQMRLTHINYGRTLGDRWVCINCKGYIVMRPNEVPIEHRKVTK